LRGKKREPSTASANGRKARRSKSAFEQLKSLLSPKTRHRRFEVTEDHILSILIARRGREAVFGPYLFSEPTWDALLELYAARLGKRRMSIADLSRVINIPRSTTVRWISALEDRGLVTSESDTKVPERTWIGLTDLGASKIKRLTDHWGAAFLSI
jgi:DNA-binding MarR family transcriptional regulator